MLWWTEVLAAVVIFPPVVGLPVLDMLDEAGVLVFCRLLLAAAPVGACEPELNVNVTPEPTSAFCQTPKAA